MVPDGLIVNLHRAMAGEDCEGLRRILRRIGDQTSKGGPA